MRGSWERTIPRRGTVVTKHNRPRSRSEGDSVEPGFIRGSEQPRWGRLPCSEGAGQRSTCRVKRSTHGSKPGRTITLQSRLLPGDRAVWPGPCGRECGHLPEGDCSPAVRTGRTVGLWQRPPGVLRPVRRPRRQCGPAHHDESIRRHRRARVRRAGRRECAAGRDSGPVASRTSRTARTSALPLWALVCSRPRKCRTAARRSLGSLRR